MRIVLPTVFAVLLSYAVALIAIWAIGLQLRLLPEWCSVAGGMIRWANALGKVVADDYPRFIKDAVPIPFGLILGWLLSPANSRRGMAAVFALSAALYLAYFVAHYLVVWSAQADDVMSCSTISGGDISAERQAITSVFGYIRAFAVYCFCHALGWLYRSKERRGN